MSEKNDEVHLSGSLYQTTNDPPSEVSPSEPYEERENYVLDERTTEREIPALLDKMGAVWGSDPVRPENRRYRIELHTFHRYYPNVSEVAVTYVACGTTLVQAFEIMTLAMKTDVKHLRQNTKNLRAEKQSLKPMPKEVFMATDSNGEPVAVSKDKGAFDTYDANKVFPAKVRPSKIDEPF